MHDMTNLFDEFHQDTGGLDLGSGLDFPMPPGVSSDTQDLMGMIDNLMGKAEKMADPNTPMAEVDRTLAELGVSSEAQALLGMTDWSMGKAEKLADPNTSEEEAAQIIGEIGQWHDQTVPFLSGFNASESIRNSVSKSHQDLLDRNSQAKLQQAADAEEIHAQAQEASVERSLSDAEYEVAWSRIHRGS